MNYRYILKLTLPTSGTFLISSSKSRAVVLKVLNFGALATLLLQVLSKVEWRGKEIKALLQTWVLTSE